MTQEWSRSFSMGFPFISTVSDTIYITGELELCSTLLAELIIMG